MPAPDTDIDSSDATRQAGRYANYFEIGHNAFEFVLDFGQLYAGEQRPRFHTRVISGPVYAKAFSHTLNDAVGEYEHDFGAIGEAVELEAPAEHTSEGEQSMTAPVQQPSQPSTPATPTDSSASLQELVKQLSASIEQLQQSISAEEAALAAQTRQLSSAKEALTASQQALQQEDQLATAYRDALERFDTSWSPLKQPLETVRGKLKDALDEAAIKAITAKVTAYDEEGSALSKAADTARADQTKADDAAANAKAAQQQASAALEQLSQSIIDKGTALDNWRAAVTALGQELQAIDLQTQPARAYLLLAEVDRFVKKRGAATSADEYREDLDAQWAAVIQAKQDTAAADSQAGEAAKAAEEAATARQDHDGKRREVLLAAMDALDAQRQQQKQPSPAPAAAAR